MSYTALLAAHQLAGEGTPSVVVHVPTIKPLDEAVILNAARRAGRVVTLEEHQAAGGFGSAVAELLGERHAVSIKRLGVQDLFGQSGAPEELLAHYGLDVAAVARAVRAICNT